MTVEAKKERLIKIHSLWYSRYHLAKTGTPSFIVVFGS